MKYTGWPVGDVVEIREGTLVLVGRIYEWSDGSRLLLKLFLGEKYVYCNKNHGLLAG